MIKPRILVVVLQAEYEPWISIFKFGSLKTWLTDIPAGTSVIQVTGYPVPTKIFEMDELIFKLLNKNRISRIRSRIPRRRLRLFRLNFKVNKSSSLFGFPAWRISIPDLRFVGTHKTLAYLKASLDEEWDYLVTTNSSTYLNLNAIANNLQSSPRVQFAGGSILERIGPGLRNQSFLHGCYRVFSRDVVEIICNSKLPRSVYYPEDAFIGDIIADYKLKYSPLTFCENFTKVLDLYVPINDSEAFRCKSGSKDSREDIAIMNSVHQWIHR